MNRKHTNMYKYRHNWNLHLPPPPPSATPSYMLLGMQINGSYLQSFSHLLANVVFVGNRNILHVRFNPWWLQLKTKHIVILYTVVFTFACLRKLYTGSRVARDCVSLFDFKVARICIFVMQYNAFVPITIKNYF